MDTLELVLTHEDLILLETGHEPILEKLQSMGAPIGGSILRKVDPEYSFTGYFDGDKKEMHYVFKKRAVL